MRFAALVLLLAAGPAQATTWSTAYSPNYTTWSTTYTNGYTTWSYTYTGYTSWSTGYTTRFTRAYTGGDTGGAGPGTGPGTGPTDPPTTPPLGTEWWETGSTKGDCTDCNAASGAFGGWLGLVLALALTGRRREG